MVLAEIQAPTGAVLDISSVIFERFTKTLTEAQLLSLEVVNICLNPSVDTPCRPCRLYSIQHCISNASLKPVKHDKEGHVRCLKMHQWQFVISDAHHHNASTRIFNEREEQSLSNWVNVLTLWQSILSVSACIPLKQALLYNSKILYLIGADASLWNRSFAGEWDWQTADRGLSQRRGKENCWPEGDFQCFCKIRHLQS